LKNDTFLLQVVIQVNTLNTKNPAITAKNSSRLFIWLSNVLSRLLFLMLYLQCPKQSSIKQNRFSAHPPSDGFFIYQ